MSEITVLGAGSWGTALAMVLADNKHNVRLWSHRKEQVEEINSKHTNDLYLPDVKLPASIIGYDSLEESLIGIDTILMAVPTSAVREVLRKLVSFVDRPLTIIHASKGMEPGTFKRISEMIAEEVPEHLLSAIVVLSGPSHAEEVSCRQITTVTSSSTSIKAAEAVQDLFINKHFRVYTNPDVVGVEIGGALKNIVALGAGISDGLGYGDNTKAALMTRGLAEIARLGTHMGANPMTFSGLTGIGDLIATCTSKHSRNWRAGNMLGQGHKLDEVLDNMGMVVEGVRTTKAVYQFASTNNVSMPITTAIYKILFENESPKEIVDELMTRMRTHEMEDLRDFASRS
ncbi:NAD(P)H-dependent glycerol-3-phosphate dehydrogenase [Bacillus solimangrovi]|uniref:Glycerol-3-phosphate dehydrogenase [NAD(P)+] n=1 Tax=Bacillus solimangrovi TaxID=1305675 RepID=A0A1E5LHE4_9BACI|nr:NAD(P)H-dependent glycerol-3-phosphate dehydrogenase [Bacillus solimangrovi]OEH93466.1 glycerol-3-phosphate dehydrogenase [Bacillus solimangrovi]